MTDLGDRVLVLIVVATALAGLFGWGTGTDTLVRLEGMEKVLVHAVLIVVYFAILLGVWKTLQRIDTRAEETG